MNPHRTLDILKEVASWKNALVKFSDHDLTRALADKSKQEFHGLELATGPYNEFTKPFKEQQRLLNEWAGGNVRSKIVKVFEKQSGAKDWRAERLKPFDVFRSLAKELEDTDKLNDKDVAQVCVLHDLGI